MMHIHKILQSRICGLLSLFLLIFITACNSQTPSDSSADVTTSDEMSFVVYKNAGCECCDKWAKHLRVSGFKVDIEVTEDLNVIKEYYGIQPRFQSCHTAVSGKTGYVFEGHVPADIIRRFITEKPDGAVGLTVPGMPVGSPGMEMGDRYDPYDVFILMGDGTTKLYVHVGPDV